MMPDPRLHSERLERLATLTLGRRRAVATVAVGILALAFALGIVIDDAEEPGIILYAVPVALLAIALGPIFGAVSGVVAGALFGLAAYIRDDPLSAGELGYRWAIAIFLGALLGLLADRLQAAESDAGRLLELANDGVCVVDASGRTTYVNPRLAEILGTTPDELLATPSEQWIAERDRARFRERMARRGRWLPERYETTLCRADGTEVKVDVSAAPVVDTRGRPRGTLAIIADVTAREDALAKLRESERRLSEAQRVAHVGSWEWDVRTNSVEWSNELHDIYGVDRGAVPTYERFLERVHPDDRELAASCIATALEERTPFAYRHRIVRADGAIRVLDANGEVVVEDGEVVRMIGTAHDVTERVEAEQRLAREEELRARAVELNDSVVQGLAVAMYHLRAGSHAGVEAALEDALERAKAIVGDLIGQVGVEPGALRRRDAADSGRRTFTPFEEESGRT